MVTKPSVIRVGKRSEYNLLKSFYLEDMRFMRPLRPILKEVKGWKHHKGQASEHPRDFFTKEA